MKVLNDHRIPFERERSFERWSIDFAIDTPTAKLALEIDGKQHLLPKRKASDREKDEALVRSGYHVLRFPWKGARGDYREYVKGQIKTLLDTYQSLNKSSECRP